MCHSLLLVLLPLYFFVDGCGCFEEDAVDGKNYKEFTEEVGVARVEREAVLLTYRELVNAVGLTKGLEGVYNLAGG